MFIVVPTSHLSTPPEADFWPFGVLSEHIENDLADQIEVSRIVALADLGIVFAEDDAQAPVQPVLHAPVLAHSGMELLMSEFGRADVSAELM